MSIGSRVRAKRKALNLSQEALARRAGVTLNAVGQLERGVSADPHYSTLLGLANALDTSVAELIGEPAVPLAEALPLDDIAEATGLSAEDARAAIDDLLRRRVVSVEVDAARVEAEWLSPAQEQILAVLLPAAFGGLSPHRRGSAP